MGFYHLSGGARDVFLLSFERSNLHAAVLPCSLYLQSTKISQARCEGSFYSIVLNLRQDGVREQSDQVSFLVLRLQCVESQVAFFLEIAILQPLHIFICFPTRLCSTLGCIRTTSTQQCQTEFAKSHCNALHIMVSQLPFLFTHPRGPAGRGFF